MIRVLAIRGFDEMGASRKLKSLVRKAPVLLRLAHLLGLDRAFTLAAFILRHRRLPDVAQTGYLNDLLIKLKSRQDNIVLRSFTTDKYFAKLFIRGALGRDMVVPTLALIEGEDALDRFVFPDRCVVKPTHMCGEIIFLDGAAPTRADRERMRGWLKTNFADRSLEPNYRYLIPRIIVEPLLRFEDRPVDDFKFHVYEGQVHVIEHMRDRYHGMTVNYFNPDWIPIQMQRRTMPSIDPSLILRPARLEEMVQTASAIGCFFKYIRVDFFTNGLDKLFVGELTHFSGDCRIAFVPTEAEAFFLSGVPRAYLLAQDDMAQSAKTGTANENEYSAVVPNKTSSA